MDKEVRIYTSFSNFSDGCCSVRTLVPILLSLCGQPKQMQWGCSPDAVGGGEEVQWLRRYSPDAVGGGEEVQGAQQRGAAVVLPVLQEAHDGGPGPWRCLASAYDAPDSCKIMSSYHIVIMSSMCSFMGMSIDTKMCCIMMMSTNIKIC